MKDDSLYLIHMLQHSRAIQSYTRGGEDAFLRDRKTRDAVMRNFEIIGEAATRISSGLRDQHPEIPWRAVIGFRNVLPRVYGRHLAAGMVRCPGRATEVDRTDRADPP